MKKLISRARQAIHTSKASVTSSSTYPAIPRSTLREQPDPQLNAVKSANVDSEVCLHFQALAESIALKWESNHQFDATSHMKELWVCFCDAGTQQNNQQQLVAFVKSLVEADHPKSDADQGSSMSLWKDLHHFKPVVERKLQQLFMTGPQAMAQWINLNHLLARISLPPASIYDLRMICLWNLRDVLETQSVVVTVETLKILMLWLGGHIHWFQLQILRAHSTNSSDHTPIDLELGDLPSRMGLTLLRSLDLKRFDFWRQRLQGLRDSNTADAAMIFYTQGVLSLLQVGIANVDEWKEEMPTR